MKRGLDTQQIHREIEEHVGTPTEMGELYAPRWEADPLIPVSNLGRLYGCRELLRYKGTLFVRALFRALRKESPSHSLEKWLTPLARISRPLLLLAIRLTPAALRERVALQGWPLCPFALFYRKDPLKSFTVPLSKVPLSKRSRSKSAPTSGDKKREPQSGLPEEGTRKRRIAILAPRFDPEDAVATDALTMHRILKKEGYHSRLFAGGWSLSDPKSPVHPVEELQTFLEEEEGSILIYHYAIFWERALEIFRTVRAIKILRHHNVTPARFFEPYHFGIANNCREGAARLKDFVAAEPALYLADSAFNLRDLADAGADEKAGRVLPPFHRIEELLNLEPDLPFLERFASDFPEPVETFLMVGRIVPNKGYAALLRSFALYHRTLNPCSRLLVVGRQDPQLGEYYRELRKIVLEEGMEFHIYFTGGLSEGALKSAYLSATAFVTLSEHEGFCVPVVEAMAFGLPVVALNRSALGDTVGDAGILQDEPDPLRFAASFHYLSRNRKASQYLREKGRERYRRVYGNEVIERRFLEILRELEQTPEG